MESKIKWLKVLAPLLTLVLGVSVGYGAAFPQVTQAQDLEKRVDTLTKDVSELNKQVFELAGGYNRLLTQLLRSVRVYEVSAGDIVEANMLLKAGDQVRGVIVIRGTEKEIDFYWLDPVGEEFARFGRVSNETIFSFVAPSTGLHTLILDNAFSSRAKDVVVLIAVLPTVGAGRGGA